MKQVLKKTPSIKTLIKTKIFSILKNILQEPSSSTFLQNFLKNLLKEVLKHRKTVHVNIPQVILCAGVNCATLLAAAIMSAGVHRAASAAAAIAPPRRQLITRKTFCGAVNLVDNRLCASTLQTWGRCRRYNHLTRANATVEAIAEAKGRGGNSVCISDIYLLIHRNFRLSERVGARHLRLVRGMK